jgi:hypothetical protein
VVTSLFRKVGHVCLIEQKYPAALYNIAFRTLRLIRSHGEHDDDYKSREVCKLLEPPGVEEMHLPTVLALGRLSTTQLPHFDLRRV